MSFTAFHTPKTLLVGGGARRQVDQQAKSSGMTRVLLVTDSGLMSRGVPQEIAQVLEAAGARVSIFERVQPDPTDVNVADGLEQLRRDACDGVVAVGGGSAIDAAKAIAVMATNSGAIHDFAGYHKIPLAGMPLIAIPTTAGTGSEATKVTVITDTRRDVKMMILSEHLVPRIALVDFELTLSMPRDLTAAVGVDTLTHGIEAYVSRKANAMTDPLALSCIRLVSQHLVQAWRQPDDREARAGMMVAACHGGLAFSNSSVCLVHGMSRPIGAVFHVPHGLSNAVLLPAVTRFSWPSAVERYATVARLLGYAAASDDDATAAGTLADGLERLNAELQLPRLRGCRGVDEARFRQSLAKMAGDALASGSPQNNPRVPTADEIVRLYEESW